MAFRWTAESITDEGELAGLVLLHEPGADASAPGAIDHRTTSSRWAWRSSSCSPCDVRSTARSRADVLFAIAFRDPEPLRELNPEVPRDLETICLQGRSRRTPAIATRTAARTWRRTCGASTNHARDPRSVLPVRFRERTGRWIVRQTRMGARRCRPLFLLAGGVGEPSSARVSGSRAPGRQAREMQWRAAFSSDLIAQPIGELRDGLRRAQARPRHVRTAGLEGRAPGGWWPTSSHTSRRSAAGAQARPGSRPGRRPTMRHADARNSTTFYKAWNLFTDARVCCYQDDVEGRAMAGDIHSHMPRLTVTRRCPRTRASSCRLDRSLFTARSGENGQRLGEVPITDRAIELGPNYRITVEHRKAMASPKLTRDLRSSVRSIRVRRPHPADRARERGHGASAARGPAFVGSDRSPPTRSKPEARGGRVAGFWIDAHGGSAIANTSSSSTSQLSQRQGLGVQVPKRVGTELPVVGLSYGGGAGLTPSWKGARLTDVHRMGEGRTRRSTDAPIRGANDPNPRWANLNSPSLDLAEGSQAPCGSMEEGKSPYGLYHTNPRQT
jgi:hypothetical protein